MTVYQPWAWLIVHGAELCPELRKDVENRSWATTYRGPLLVHASVRIDVHAYEQARELVERAFGGELARRLPSFQRAHALPRGGIIGVVQLVDVKTPNERTSPWHMPGYLGWMLREPKALPFYPVRGQQGVWGRFTIVGGVVREVRS